MSERGRYGPTQFVPAAVEEKKIKQEGWEVTFLKALHAVFY